MPTEDDLTVTDEGEEEIFVGMDVEVEEDDKTVFVDLA